MKGKHAPIDPVCLIMPNWNKHGNRCEPPTTKLKSRLAPTTLLACKCRPPSTCALMQCKQLPTVTLPTVHAHYPCSANMLIPLAFTKPTRPSCHRKMMPSQPHANDIYIGSPHCPYHVLALPSVHHPTTCPNTSAGVLHHDYLPCTPYTYTCPTCCIALWVAEDGTPHKAG